ncbi:glycosyltransferase [Lentilitoribacter sp. Alg239-R112]|uniref:glycosyltransferase family 2 protein n=1 Tax=Lentilitoribacter sp. Alg239-R112 TaxID=2305987 RepID=UPI0013A6901D|nr:glycosyltransferase [Lentilitoribacter sp. Alg239-R112]
MKKLSICIPNYNCEKYLKKCIESAINLDYANKEIIVADDCSSDNSVKVAELYKDEIKLIINRDNLGQTKNTNLVLENATGDYIILLHSDDFLLPDATIQLLSKLENHPNVVMAAGERFICDEQDNLKPETALYNCNCIIPAFEQARVFMFTSFLPCQVIVRSSVMRRIGGVNVDHVVNLDGLLWFTCALQGDVLYSQEPVAAYRKHSASTTAQYNRTSDHIIEYYLTLREMHRLGKGIPVLEDNFASSKKRVGEIGLKYAAEPLKEGLVDIAHEYLNLAKTFNCDIHRKYEFKLIEFCCENYDSIEPQLMTDLLNSVDKPRKESYDPPKGYIKI